MMGVSHAYSGVAAGIAGASLVLPHAVTWPDLGVAAYTSGGLLGLAVALPALLIGALLLPGFLVPDDAIPDAPLAVVAVWILLAGGAALLPDADHPSSTVSRVLGPITGAIGWALERLSMTVYHATRLERDPPDRRSGHRLLTHTYVGSAGFAAVFALALLVSPIAGAVACGLVAALLAVGVRRYLRTIPVVREAPGFAVGTVTGFVAWHAITSFPAWSAAFPLAVFLGCAIHREGDWCTNSGVPRRFWPLPEEQGTRRWKLHRSPRPFDTGKDEERYVVRPALALSMALGVATTLLLPALGPALVAAADGTAVAGGAR